MLTDITSSHLVLTDSESPNITCPTNRTIFTDAGQDFATFSLRDLSSGVDNSGFFTVSIDVAGVQYVVGDSVTLNLTDGVHLVQYTATDNATNSETCDTYITVEGRFPGDNCI